MKYQQDLNYLENHEDLANEFMDNAGLYKYPSELEVGYEGIKLQKGDTIALIDKNLGINGTYKVIKIKRVNELETAKLKFIKING